MTKGVAMSPKPFLEPFLPENDEEHNLRDSFGQFLYRGESDAPLPSGHQRSEYHRYGLTDEDIEFWGLDQPGAPPPDAVWWAVVDLLDKMG
jgi:hypothetical protein